jgi:hypothetical protein
MRMRGLKAGIVVVASLGFSLLPSLSQAPSSTARAADSWCGDSFSKDWVCRWEGQAFYGPGPGNLQLLPWRRPRRLVPRTHVATSPYGRARLAFLDDANCTVGGGTKGSEVVVRWEDVVLRQIRGGYRCISATSASIKSFCDPSGDNCKVKFTSRGAYLAQLAALPEATASLTERFRRHAQIVICSGFVKVNVESEGNSSQTVGRWSGEGRFVITIEELVERTEDEIVTPDGSSSTSSSSSSINVEVVGTLPGRGRCAGSSTQTQEQVVEE